MNLESRTGPPLAVPPLEAARLLSLGVTRIYALMRDGELRSYIDGRTRRVTMASLHGYIARQLAASDSVGWQQWRASPPATRATRHAAHREQNAE
jgi:excisionase family DNA binding protein